MAVDSFGEKRGMFKGNQLKSYEIKKVAKYYQDKLDIEHEEALSYGSFYDHVRSVPFLQHMKE